MRIKREGIIRHTEARLAVWEEGLTGNYDARNAWERQFKKDVFTRVIQQMRRLGWSTEVPADYIKDYGRRFAESHRYCRKGDLEARLGISGRCIELEFYQNVNFENPNGGRYDFNKESKMTYLMWLEMQRTRNKIRTYLCNVFEGYTFEDRTSGYRRNTHNIPGALTSEQWLQEKYAESWHFKGDLSKYTIENYNRKSADGPLLEHGQRVWFYDRKGRLNTGIAWYNINNMWWVITGKYGHDNKAGFDLFTRCPENPRQKRNDDLRRRRIEAEMGSAIKSMNFERAAILRDILWPQNEPLFMVWHSGHCAFHSPGWRGYTADSARAGKFTRAELDDWLGKGVSQKGENRVVSCSQKEAA